MPITLKAPLLPPLKEPVGTIVLEDEVEEDVLVDGVEFGVGLVERPETEDGEPAPEEVDEESEEVEERAGSMSNVVVWESTTFTFPTGEAWRVYPEPEGTAGRATVTF